MMIKKMFPLIIFIVICFWIAGCKSKNLEPVTNEVNVSIFENEEQNNKEELTKKLKSKEEASMKICVSVNENTIIYELNNSKASKDLYEQLPLIIESETYANNEIIFYPPSSLDTEDAPLASKGGAGVLAYYAPWGNVVMYYDTFGSASGLYELGQVVSGSEYIKSMSGILNLTKSEE